jgi:hypothetical protein
MTRKKEEIALNFKEVVRNRVLWQSKEKYTTRPINRIAFAHLHLYCSGAEHSVLVK